MQLWSWEHIRIGRPIISRVRDPPDEPEDYNEPLIIGSQHQHGVDPLACSWLRVHFCSTHTASGLPYYRDALDRQTNEQMTWQPYTEEVLASLPEICRSDHNVMRTFAPLICFDIVEYHLLGRVMRQFGLEQPIPTTLDTSDKLHKVDKRKLNRNYDIVHEKYIEEWRKREDRVVSGHPFSGRTLLQYMNWYRHITRTIITPPTQIRPSTHYQPASTELVLSHALGDIAQRCMRIIEVVGDLPMEKALPLTLESLRTINAYCAGTLTRVDQSHLLQDSEVLQPPSASTPSSSSLQSVLHSQAPRKRKHSALRGRGRGPFCQLSTSSPSVSSPALTTTPMLSSSTLTTSTPLPSFTPRPSLLAATSSPSFTSMLPHNYSGISTHQVPSSTVVSPPLVYARRITFTTSPILEVDESNFETP